jgi:hypothetical protein
MRAASAVGYRTAVIGPDSLGNTAEMLRNFVLRAVSGLRESQADIRHKRVRNSNKPKCSVRAATDEPIGGVPIPPRSLAGDNVGLLSELHGYGYRRPGGAGRLNSPPGQPPPS